MACDICYGGVFNQTQLREKLGTQTHDLCLLRSSQTDAGLWQGQGGAQFSIKDLKTFWVPWIPAHLVLLRAGGLVACSHMKLPNNKNSQKLATSPHSNACNGSRSNKRHHTAEILPISFPSTTEWNLLALVIILKACSILLDAGKSHSQVFHCNLSQDKGFFVTVYLQLV